MSANRAMSEALVVITKSPSTKWLPLVRHLKNSTQEKM